MGEVDLSRRAFSFAAALGSVEGMLVEELGLERLPLREVLGRVENACEGRPAELTTRAYAGALVQYARVVTLRADGIDVGSLFVVPCASLAAPLLSVDLLAVSARGLAIAELIPVVDEHDHERVTVRIPSVLEPANELPAWCGSSRSAGALQAWVDADRPAVATDLVGSYVGAFTSMLRSAPQADVRARHTACLRDQREHAPAGPLLVSMFGPAFARSFVTTVMYPDTLFG
jgi:hypothetical protein